MTIKAIETKYKGYRFRSRLEARWAVFFDAMNEEWEYEKEGYDLGDHGYYLPDFYLPRFDSFVEIKGAAPTREELHKAESLRDHSGKTVAIFHGVPGEHLGTLYTFDIGDSSGGWSECEVCLGNNPYDGELVFGVFFTHRTLYKDMNFTEELPFIGGEYIPIVAVEIAADAARSARFEHGETPK